MDPKIEELAKDPVMGRAFRELGRPLAEHATGKAPPANGNDDYSGPPTSGLRARNITQDRPSEMVPSYELPGRESGEALAWHRQASDLAAGLTRSDGPANDATARTATENAAPAQSQIHPAVAHMHPELGKALTAVFEQQMQMANAQPADPTPTLQPPPMGEGQSVQPAGMEATVYSPEFAKIKETVSQAFKEAREGASAARQEGQDSQPKQTQAREGRGR